MPKLKQIKQHRILLDTHVIIWSAQGDQKLSSGFREAIDRAQEEDRILISAISLWEIGMLVTRGKITIDRDVLDWTEELLAQPGITLAPITPQVAIQSSRLPGEPHGDPADRMLIATARQENACLVTKDSKILEYGSDHYLSVFDPTE